MTALDWIFTDEHRAFRQEMRTLVARDVAPHAAAVDETETYPWDAVRAARDAGLFGVNLPREFGGQGRDLLSWYILMEEAAVGCATFANVLVETWMCASLVRLAGSESLQAEIVLEMARGDRLGVVAVTEPHAGSDAAAIRTRADAEGDGFLLTGEKWLIASAGQADYYGVLAVTDHAAGTRGTTAFLVGKDAPGLTFERQPTMGLRGLCTGRMRLERVRVPRAAMLGRAGEGFKNIMRLFDRSRPAVSAMCVGMAQAALDYAVAYARERRAFGQTVADFQAIQFLLADMAADLEAARALVYDAAVKLERDPAGRHTIATSLAKLKASDMLVRVATDAVQVVGGFGYTRACPIERTLRDAKVFQIFEGTNQIHRMLIARDLLR
jgi:alkylation response protein AidB-like acyl-CoA dehydrogenase